MHLSTPSTSNRNIHIYQNPTKRTGFSFLKKTSGGPAYSERKVVNKKLGSFVVIFIYLKERNFGKKNLCRIWLIARKITKISALNPFVKMIGRGREGAGAVQSSQYFQQLVVVILFQIFLFMLILNLLHSSILKIIAGIIIVREVFELISTRRTHI